jgi:tetratricopeptide (TPR) repeat protein
MKIISTILPLFISFTLFAQTNNHFLNGTAALEKNDFVLAEQELTMAINNNVNVNKSTLYRGITYFRMEKYSEAKNDFNTLIKTGNNLSFLWLAKIYAIENNPLESISYLKKHLAIHGNQELNRIAKDDSFDLIKSSSAWNNFVSTSILTEQEEEIQNIKYLVNKKNFKQARELIQFHTSSNKSPETHELSALMYESEKSFELAIYEMKKALELDPENIDYQIKLGDYFAEVNKYQKATEVYQEVVSTAPENFNVYLKLANSYYLSDLNKKAEKQIEFFLNYFPDNKQAILLASKIYLKSQSYTQALRQVNKLFNATTIIEADYFLTRGEIYYQTGSYKYSSNDLSMYLDLNPNDPNANYLLGNAHNQLGNKRLACYYWERALNFGSLDAIEQIQKNCK